MLPYKGISILAWIKNGWSIATKLSNFHIIFLTKFLIFTCIFLHERYSIAQMLNEAGQSIQF